jgi:transposase-like protein
LKSGLELFKWKQYESGIILLTVRLYLKYSLSYHDLVEMMEERGLQLAHTTIIRWVRMDETYIKVKGQWKYLYRAVEIQTVIQLICKCNFSSISKDSEVF